MLSLYSFDKYKTIKEKEEKNNSPSKLLLFDDIAEKDINWLNELTNAVYFSRDLITNL